MHLQEGMDGLSLRWWGKDKLHIEFEASLGYIRFCLRKKGRGGSPKGAEALYNTHGNALKGQHSAASLSGSPSAQLPGTAFYKWPRVPSHISDFKFSTVNPPRKQELLGVGECPAKPWGTFSNNGAPQESPLGYWFSAWGGGFAPQKALGSAWRCWGWHRKGRER